MTRHTRRLAAVRSRAENRLADLRTRQVTIAARLAEADADQPVPYTLTPRAEEELDLAAEAEAEWADEWDSADSAAYQARVEAGLESEAGL